MRRIVFASLLVLLLACGLATGQNQRLATPQIEIDIGGVGKIRIPDLELRDQDGRKVRFYSDLIKNKVVVLSFFYTSCNYTCTMQGQTFSKLQSLLGEQLGTSVFLISVTTDPAKDDPAVLKAWGKRYDAQPGWTLVTGNKADMNKLLLPFTGNLAGAGMHLPSIFIGNDKTGLWTSAAGVLEPQDVLRAVDYVMRQ